MKGKIILLIILSFFSCTKSSQIPPGEPSGFIQIKGSDTMVNVAQGLAEEFMKHYPYIYVAVTGGGSGTGIASLINGTCDIATASRKMKDKELRLAEKNEVEPREYIVGYDGLAVVVHPSNPVEKLTIKQLSDIYTGTIKNWKDVGGRDEKIVLLSREVNSGTHVYFKEHVLRSANPEGKAEFAADCLLLSSSQAIAEEVAQNPSAIGYFGMGYLNDRVKAIAIAINKKSGYFPPTVENVISGKYPISRPLFIYISENNPNKELIDLFIKFIFSEKGQKQFILNGFVPLKK